MTEITRVCIDASNSVFTLHGVDAHGRAVLRRNALGGFVVKFLTPAETGARLAIERLT